MRSTMRCRSAGRMGKTRSNSQINGDKAGALVCAPGKRCETTTSRYAGAAIRPSCRPVAFFPGEVAFLTAFGGGTGLQSGEIDVEAQPVLGKRMVIDLPHPTQRRFVGL